MNHAGAAHVDPLSGCGSDGRRQWLALRAAAQCVRAVRGGHARDAQLLQPARIGIEDFDLEVARPGHDLAARGQPPDARHHVARERVDLVGDVADIEFRPDRLHDLFQMRARVREERAVRLAHNRRRFVLVVLILDFAENLLDHVLHRDDAVGAAVFVDHQRQMDARRLHLGEQVERRHRGRHEQDLADDLGLVERDRKIDCLEIETRWKRLLALALRGPADCARRTM